MRTTNIMAGIMVILLIASISMAQSILRVEKGENVDFTPDYTDADGDSVVMRCRRTDNSWLYSGSPGFAVSTSGLSASLTGTRYDFDCRLVDITTAPKTSKSSVPLAKTATLYVHECPGGYRWDSDVPNADRSRGTCVKDGRLECSNPATQTQGNYVCYKEPTQLASKCVGNPITDLSLKNWACCAANTAANNAVYDAFVGIGTY